MSPQEIIEVLQLLPREPEIVGRVAIALMGEVTPQTIKQKVDQPSTPATPQTTQAPSGNVMIPAGFVCKCDACKMSVYKIGMDVRETMGKKDFVACFMPLGDAPELKMPLDTFADASGNLAIDCPLCKGTKTLWIKGHGEEPFNAAPETGE